jgi:hypothetical protein
MKRHWKLLTSTAAATLFMIAAASATVVTVKGTYTVTLTPVDGGVSAEPTVTYDLPHPFTESLTVGNTFTPSTNFFTTSPAGSCNNGCADFGSHHHQIANDDITVTFSFTAPSGATGQLVATGAYTANYFNDTDAVTWNSPNPLVIHFADGGVLDIKLINAADWAITPLIQFDMTTAGGGTGGGGVPEPTSLAIMGACLATLGLFWRRRKV